MISHRAILFLLLALALVRGILYASIVSPWQAPDEPAQFERARASLTAVEWNSTSENGPLWYDELAQALFTFNFWDFLPANRAVYTPDTPLGHYIALYQEVYLDVTYSGRLPYTFIGSPLFLARSQNIVFQLYLVRLNTVLMNVGIVFFAFLIAQTIFPKDSFLIFGAPILILFNPQHTHLLAAVNNGNLAELLTVIVLYFIINGIIKGWTWLKGLMVFILMLLALSTKATTYFLPFVIGTIAFFYLWQYRRYWRWLLPGAALLAGLGLYLAPQRIYVLIGQMLHSYQNGDFYLDPLVPTVMFRSFWAMPGWLTLNLHPFWYQAVAVGCGLAIVGLIVLLISKWRLIFSKQHQPKIRALVLLSVAALVAISIPLIWSTVTNTIIYRQGRSIYSVIVPISLFLMLGWRQLIPRQWRNFGLFAITSALFLFDSLVLFNYIVPFFYSRY